MTPEALAELRGICLALPQAIEKQTWGNPTFRVRDKIFAMVHAVNGRLGVWCKAPSGVQAILVEAAPDRFFSPPYVGAKGGSASGWTTPTGPNSPTLSPVATP
jgi:hypothetical protein